MTGDWGWAKVAENFKTRETNVDLENNTVSLALHPNKVFGSRRGQR